MSKTVLVFSGNRKRRQQLPLRLLRKAERLAWLEEKLWLEEEIWLETYDIEESEERIRELQKKREAL